MGTSTHPVSVQNGATDYVVDLLDAGAGAGYMDIKASDDTVLATVVFSATAFGSASAGVATANAITSDPTPAVAGTAAKFSCYDSNASEVFSGNVTATGGGGSLELTTLSILTTVPVSISSFTYQALIA